MRPVLRFLILLALLPFPLLAQEETFWQEIIQEYQRDNQLLFIKQYILLIILTIALALVVLLRQRKKQNRALEQKVAERTKALKEQTTFLNNIINSVPGVVYRTKVDKKYTPIYVSEAAKEMFGYSPQELTQLGVQGADLYQSSDLQLLDKLIHEAITSGQTVEMVSEIKTPKGEKKWILDRFQTAYDEKEKSIVSDGLIIDITDKIKTEDALRKSEKQLSLIYNNTHDHVGLLDINENQELIIESMNEALKAAWRQTGLNINLNEYYGQNVTKYLHLLVQGDLKQIQKHLNYLYATVSNKTLCRYEDILYPPSGRKMHVEVTVVPILGELDKVCKKLLVVIRDTTDMKLAQEQILKTILETEDRERSRMARELHDSLGQQLTTASLHFKYLHKMVKTWPEEEQKKFQTGLQQLDNAINESRQIAHNLMPQSIADFGYVLSMESLLEQLEESTSIEFLFYNNLRGERIIMEYEFNLFRITQEAINNALKYAHATQVIIQLMKHSDRIILSIEDNGRGFELEKGHQGLGLGNIKNRVTALSGIFTLDSTPGRGTILTIEIPLST